jgi:hypothetical protein
VGLDLLVCGRVLELSALILGTDGSVKASRRGACLRGLAAHRVEEHLSAEARLLTELANAQSLLDYHHQLDIPDVVLREQPDKVPELLAAQVSAGAADNANGSG